MTEHVYWAVSCKTVGCAALMRLRYAGTYHAEPYFERPNDAPEQLDLRCSFCRNSYTYIPSELFLHRTAEPPALDFEDRLRSAEPS
jgi:hypothetical protein